MNTCLGTMILTVSLRSTAHKKSLPISRPAGM
jgi:hypothetical protein